MLRLIFWLSVAAALLALAFAASARFHLTKVSTEDAVTSIEKYVVDRDRLTPERDRMLDRALSTIRSNDRGQERVVNELRRISIYGFLAVTAIFLALAGWSHSWSRERRPGGGIPA